MNRGLLDLKERSFKDSVVASALEQLMHRKVVFNIKGPSLPMREHQALAEALKT